MTQTNGHATNTDLILNAIVDELKEQRNKDRRYLEERLGSISPQRIELEPAKVIQVNNRVDSAPLAAEMAALRAVVGEFTAAISNIRPVVNQEPPDLGPVAAAYDRMAETVASLITVNARLVEQLTLSVDALRESQENAATLNGQLIQMLADSQEEAQIRNQLLVNAMKEQRVVVNNQVPEVRPVVNVELPRLASTHAEHNRRKDGELDSTHTTYKYKGER